MHIVSSGQQSCSLWRGPFGGFNTEACGRGCVGGVNCEVINIMEEIWLGQMPGFFGTFYDKRISLRTEDRFCHRRIPSSLRPWVAGDERPLIIEHPGRYIASCRWVNPLHTRGEFV
ncbi:hypothetical protein EHS86_06710 [Erwinia amylovora]|uniref:Uncharacterized protein n=2 Tax=Erwinia amylovora TaxID=552 RepID=A0A831EV03_ERWAM|nr:hypothetical protein AD997_16270 [Erwinia amylovora]EKV52381.1 hypothetical protein EaACW_3397 [Erwinia amylovora ACW56400]CBA23527.1 hypothetical protein predicted by Glimmer/Critica [Erwinia amylovora CFBP1430]CCO80234.1 hypothetical protein BN432_3465 [Erwinia amylovora Ea356]CCO84041.1 hypothetical protein BN433_3495 [Erwinia amylovora Ea266]CCO87800.1 hypothetical protein BN434_3441 [Erwinia amylovora CFBP 2585]CCO91590.1 hypothetical protein BN435_3448 [Erwinia amylovora 01SFR-BO]CC